MEIDENLREKRRFQRLVIEGDQLHKNVNAEASGWGFQRL